MPPWDLRRPFFAVTLLVIFNLFSIIDAIDTITKTQFISDSKNEAIVSSNGKFKLGFFSSGNSLGRYVGIWFYKVSKYTVVWVANRENPLKNSTGIFKISGDGNLAVFDSNVRTPLWSTNMSMPSAPTSAKLLDSGNLVLVARNEEYSNTESIIWQSFDYPTDTVLPGMKFGLDQKTGLNRILTSWKSSDEPAEGDYSFGLDPHGSLQYFLNKNSAPYWRGGPWNGRTLNGVPEIMTRLKNNEVDFSNEVYLFNYSYVHNHEETYIIFNVTVNSIFSTLMVDADGTLNRLIWKEHSLKWVFRIEPEDMCDEYASCGKYAICNFNNAMKCACLPGFKPRAPKDLPLECVEKRKFQCGKGAGEGFVKLARVKIPDTSTARVYGNLSLHECNMECLRTCNCSGYASTDIDEGGLGCLAWFGELNDMQQYTEEGQDFYLRLNAMDLAAYERKNSKAFLGTKRMDMVVMLSITLAVLLLVSSCYILRRKHAARKGHKERQRRREILLMESKSSLMSFKDSTNANECEDSINVELTFFDLGTIMDATENFSSDNKLGQGGFGPVYKGQLHNGQEIAIKRLSKNSGQGIVEFKNEVLLIAKLQHRNLVRLVGCCIEEEEKMLIYEYMPNKSLDYFLFDQKRKALLDWEKRFEIILGIARGILYLHQDSRLRIIHRDYKTSNILLDGEMKPKISDFGTARIFEGNQSRANTCRVVGTFGYMSPEYALGGLFSMKFDVFSFGVIVLEIISGRKVCYLKETSKNLIQHAWDLWSDGKALEMVDSSISNSCPALEVLQCIQVGLLCVQDIAEDRPTMSNVVFMLSNETTLPSPKQPTFATIRNQIDPISFTTGTNSFSVNEVTVTTLDAR